MLNASILPRLKRLEWSTGNGQCPCCLGLGPSFQKESNCTLGHEDDCLMADLLTDYGDSPSSKSANLPNEYVATIKVIDGMLGGEAMKQNKDYSD